MPLYLCNALYLHTFPHNFFDWYVCTQLKPKRQTKNTKRNDKQIRCVSSSYFPFFYHIYTKRTLSRFVILALYVVGIDVIEHLFMHQRKYFNCNIGVLNTYPISNLNCYHVSLFHNSIHFAFIHILLCHSTLTVYLLTFHFDLSVDYGKVIEGDIALHKMYDLWLFISTRL